MNNKQTLRELLDEDDIIVAPGVHDALVAKVVDDMKLFDVMLVTGSGGALSRHGLPDAGLVTMTETVDHAKGVNDTVDVPMIADAENGYGNATNVVRTVREFCRAGVAGIVLEDQAAPKRNGNVKGKRVISREEAIGKVRAAVDTRDEIDLEFFVIARTGARGAVDGSLTEALVRANAFLEEGADMAFVQGPTSREEARRIATEVDGPTLYVGTGVAPRLQPAEAAEMGYDMQMFGRILTYTAMLAVRDATADLYEEGADALADIEEEFFESFGTLHEFAGMDEIREQEERYLPSAEQSKYEDSLGYDLSNG